MKLNLGSGPEPLHLPGYENWDRKDGREAYPLNVPDQSCWAIRASHVLEHFSHREVKDVVANWVSKLAPGGCLKIAVPDFAKITWEYHQNRAENPRGYLMGGHADEDDRHGCTFDRHDLFDLMRENKLEGIGPWESEIQDCASHRYSLNLQGFKPTLEGVEVIPSYAVYAGLAAPRFAPVEHFRCTTKCLQLLGLSYDVQQGCYWHQNMCELMERALARKSKYFLALDYDTIFNTTNVMELYRLLEAYPEADAVASVQAKRLSNCPLYVAPDKEGKPLPLTPQELDRPLARIFAAHFGLTMFRCESLAKFPRPWMQAKPNEDGRWADGHMDADMSFWYRWNEVGLKLFLANRVVVGHMSEMIEWPGKDFKTVVQPLRDYEREGIPGAVVR
jgi:hypothetical protein